jgi:predicted DNA-binding transcriptional regulator AlpA
MVEISEKQCAHRASTPDVSTTGFYRLPQIIGPHGLIPVSKSTWWAGVKDGRYPKPVKLGPRTTAWRREDIHGLIEELASDN